MDNRRSSRYQYDEYGRSDGDRDGSGRTPGGGRPLGNAPSFAGQPQGSRHPAQSRGWAESSRHDPHSSQGRRGSDDSNDSNHTFISDDEPGEPQNYHSRPSAGPQARPSSGPQVHPNAAFPPQATGGPQPDMAELWARAEARWGPIAHNPYRHSSQGQAGAPTRAPSRSPAHEAPQGHRNTTQDPRPSSRAQPQGYRNTPQDQPRGSYEAPARESSRASRHSRAPSHAPSRAPASRPPPPAEDQGEGIAEAFWPDLRPRLQTDADLRNLLIECAICTVSTSDIMVLHCGHMLCKGCLDRVHSTMEGEPDDPFYVQQRKECPFCKLRLGMKPACLRECRDTRAGRFGLPIPKTMAQLDDFPLTVPEGGSNAQACARCRERQIKGHLDGLVAALLNCDMADKRLIQVVPGQTMAEAEDELEDEFSRVPALQPLLDSVNALAVEPNFSRKYTGVFPERQAIQGFVAFRMRSGAAARQGGRGGEA